MNKDNLIEFAKEQCEIFPEDSYMGKYLRETIKILQAEPCEDAISREDAIKAVDHHTFDTDDGLCLDEDISIILEEVAPKQEFCEDCVSRKSLKHKLQERHDFFVDAYGGFINLPQKDKARVDAITNCIAMVVNEPPVTPTQKWIPVSERLPKPYTFVNATCRSLVDDRENWVIETLYLPIPKENNEQGYSDWGNIPMLNWHKAEVIAWMERKIPEPYKEEGEE